MVQKLSFDVKVFGRYRELLPGACISVEVSKGSTVAELITRLHERYPGILPPRPSVAVNQRLARDSDVVGEGDELALIPAVAGG